MRRLVIAVTLALLCTVSASAQFLPPPPGVGFINGGGFSFGYHSRRFGLFGSFGSSSFYSYGGYPPVWGGYYGYSSVVPLFPPTIVIQQPVIVPPRPQPVNDPEPPPIDLERFIVISPDKPLKKEVARIPPPNPPAKIERPLKPVELGIKIGELPLALKPEMNPRAEADRQVEWGRTAFSNGEMGRALERFKKAVATAPAEATGYFMLAQTQFALGKYLDAVANLEAGLKHRPDWPQARFKPRELYGLNPAMFDEHLRQLRTALEATPADPRLQFLLGVELWFDGKQDEAKRLFEMAAKGGIDAEIVKRFVE